MKPRISSVLLFVSLIAPGAVVPAATLVKLTRADDRIRVELGGKLFTEYIFKGAPKPFLYPILASDGTEMMRHFPVQKGVPGEVEDHPHHRSLWFTHGAVNGIDFWGENTNQCGKIVSESVESAVKNGVGTIRARNRWVGPEGSVYLTDETTIRIRGSADARFLDYEVTLKAPRRQSRLVRRHEGGVDGDSAAIVDDADARLWQRQEARRFRHHRE